MRSRFGKKSGKEKDKTIRKSHRFRKIVFLLVLLVILYNLLTSIWFCTNIFLPLVSRCSGCTIRASEAKIRLFQTGKQIEFKKLHVDDHSGFSMNAEHSFANFSLLRLFTGKVAFHDITIEGVKVQYNNFLLSAKKNVEEKEDKSRQSYSLLPSWLVLENITVSAMTFQYIGEKTYNNINCYIQTFKINTLSQDQKITCKFKTDNMTLRFIKRTSVCFDVECNMNMFFYNDGLPKTIDGNITLDNYDSDADDDKDGDSKTVLKCDFEFSPSISKHNTFSLKKFKVQHFVDNKHIGDLSITGDYNFKTDFFVGNATASSNTIQSVVELFQLKNDLKASSFSSKVNATLSKNKDKIDFDIHSAVSMKQAYDGTIKIVEAGDFSGQVTMQYDLSKKDFVLTQFYADAFAVENNQKKNVLTARLSKRLHLKENKESHSYSFSANDSEISIQTTNFPIPIVNLFFPIRFYDGNLDSHFSLRADEKSKRFLGDFKAYGTNVEFPRYNGKQVIKKHDLAISGTINSDGLSEIRELSLEKTHLSFLPANSKRDQTNGGFPKTSRIYADMSGKYLFLDHILSLTGDLTTHPFSPDSAFFHLYPEKIKKKIIIDKADNDEFKFKINTMFYFNKRLIDFSGVSSLKIKFLPGMRNEKNPLSFSFAGQVGARKKQQFFRLNKCVLDLPQHLHFKVNGKADLTVDSIQSKDDVLSEIKLETLSAKFVRSIVTLIESEDEVVNEIMEKLHYHNISAKTDFAYYPIEKKIELKDINLNFLYRKNSSIHLYVDKPMIYSCQTKKFAQTTGYAELKKLDLDFINMLVRRKTGFLFESIPTDGHIDFVFRNGIENIDFTAFFDTTNFSYKKFGSLIYLGDCKIKLNGTFCDYFKYMKYQNSQADIFQKNKKCTAVDAFGKVLFAFPYDTDIKFDFKDVTEEEVQNLHEALNVNFDFKKFVGNGSFTFKCTDDINILEYGITMNIDEMKLQSFSTRVPDLAPLKGKIKWNVIYNDRLNTIDVLEAFAHFQQKQDDKCVFDAKYTGRLSKNTNEMPDSELKSDGIDWLYWICAMKPSSQGNKTDNAKNKFGVPVLSSAIYENTKSAVNLPQKMLPDPLVAKTNQAMDKTKEILPNKIVSGTEKAVSVPENNIKKAFEATADMTQKIVPTTGTTTNPTKMLPIGNKKEKTHYTWPFTTEFSPFEFHNNRTKVKLDVKNWTYTDYFNSSVKGTMVVKDNIFSMGKIDAKINQAEVMIDSSISVNQQTGWGIDFYAKISNLDIVPFVMVFGEGNEETKKKITGTFSKAEFYLRTTGVTAEKLDKNLKFDSRIEMKSFSFPLNPHGEATFVTYLVYPITVFSSAIDSLTDSSTVKKNLMTSFSDSYGVLSGSKNVEFERGQLRLHSDDKKCSDIHVDKCLLIGPTMKIRFGNKSVFNPVHNYINADTHAVFCGLPYYVKLQGYLDDPQAQNLKSFVDILAEHSKHFAKKTVNTITLGKIPMAEWTFEDYSSLPPLNKPPETTEK